MFSCSRLTDEDSSDLYGEDSDDPVSSAERITNSTSKLQKVAASSQLRDMLVCKATVHSGVLLERMCSIVQF